VRSSAQERIEHHEPPDWVAAELAVAGGLNPYNEPMFKVVWGFNRIVPMHGEWQTFGKYKARLTDKFTGHHEERDFIKLESSVIETRLVPKYLPGNAWHLEMWRPPEEYGSPEEWRKLGEEVIGGLTVDTAGPFPSRGEYELCYPLTTDATSRGEPLPLIADLVMELAARIRQEREQINLVQRRAAIEQRVRREEEGYVKKVRDQLKDGMRPFAGEPFIVKPH